MILVEINNFSTWICLKDFRVKEVYQSILLRETESLEKFVFGLRYHSPLKKVLVNLNELWAFRIYIEQHKNDNNNNNNNNNEKEF